jgi:5'-3' exonuclease
MSNKRVMIVDAHNQFLRSYIVDPSLSSNGSPIGGTKGFLKILNKLCREINPDLIFMVWDGEGGSTKRKLINKEYKKGRKPPRPRLNRSSRDLTPEQEFENKLWQQMKLIEMLNFTPVIQFLESSVEADDIISYIKQSEVFTNWQKVIVSSDKDFIQILDDKTLLYRPTQSEVLNEQRIVEKYGIHPTNFALARAIVGDKSDNLVGVRSVGLATVSKRFAFLKEAKTYQIGDVLEHARQEATGARLRVYESIIESESLICENYKIMQLYSPLLSVSLKQKIDSIIEEYTPEFNKTALRKEMIKEGFGEITLSDLFVNFNSTISNFSLFF